MLLSDPLQAPTTLLPSLRSEYPEWHRGRPRYALWSIPVDCPVILQRRHEARQLLGDWLHPAQGREAHISLFVCGFPCAEPCHDDDIGTAVLQAQQSVLAGLNVAPFELQLGGLDSFASAAFLGVQDNGQLEHLRQALAPLSTEIRQAAYVPHLTVGIYRHAVSASQWRERAEPLRDCPPLTLAVRELQLVSYDTRELQGPLRIEAQVALA
ncbi:2'-5' RNA ligase family protein [Pseudomonas sp. Gutcm_11s]|uniref:2'-5' RNA ligase family protein n=1 Tax=Pseudomonas sp. Gutcm_11s TaxID=3026088 RepID=UPI0023606A58|nr:2'-5' RNA ligase family protein [Pseudomonas sp. Gutcm_11s]MDD0841805.1 2'-5' RNA ligase family protein [Pseudomonas sp. Gutcm_11s]